MGGTCPFHRRDRSIVVTDLSQLRFHASTRPPAKQSDELLLPPTFQPTCPNKTKVPGSQVQRYSLRLASFLTFVSRRSLVRRSTSQRCRRGSGQMCTGGSVCPVRFGLPMDNSSGGPGIEPPGLRCTRN